MRLFVLSCLFFVTLSATAQEESCKVTTPPTIDGKMDDWTQDWLNDGKDKFNYNICFDDTKLYLRIKISDGPTQQKFAFYGFTIWLDPSGKKKEKVGLRYPTGIEAQERMEEYTKQSESLAKESNLDKREERLKAFKRDMITNIEMLELLGFADEPISSSKSGITNGIQVALDMDEKDAFIYEVALPFKSFRLSKADIKVLGVGLETGKIVVKQTKGKGDDAGGGMQQPGAYGGGAYNRYGYGPSGIGYGGYGNGGAGQYGGRSSVVTMPAKMWTTVKLQ